MQRSNVWYLPGQTLLRLRKKRSKIWSLLLLYKLIQQKSIQSPTPLFIADLLNARDFAGFLFGFSQGTLLKLVSSPYLWAYQSLHPSETVKLWRGVIITQSKRTSMVIRTFPQAIQFPSITTQAKHLFNRFKKNWTPNTLQEINISHLGKRKIIFKMPFWGDMLVPWRVSQTGQASNFQPS